MGELWESLQQFGFTQYESRTYIALVRIGPSTAYQVSKVSEIPRARIYDVLDGLTARGVVMLQEDQEGNKIYRPLPVDVLLDQLRHEWEASFSDVSEQLKSLAANQPKSNTFAATLRGEENVLAFCRILLRRAKSHVSIAMWGPMYDKLLPELEELVGTGRRVKGIVFGVQDPVGELCLHRMNRYMASISEERWFILSVDGTELLYGHSAEQNGNAFYTDDPVHLYLFEDYIWHDVLVNRLVEMGSQAQLDEWILPEMERFFGKKMLP